MNLLLHSGETLAVLGTLFLVYYLVRPLFSGAVYFPTPAKSIEMMLALSAPQTGERVADLGSGDGRIIIEFAKRGFEAHGYEIDLLRVLQSRRRIKKLELEKKAFIHWQSFWQTDLAGFNIVTVYGYPNFMTALGAKLERELRPGARVFSQIYALPGWREKNTAEHVRLYIK